MAVFGAPVLLALSVDNPYNPIVTRNVFALKDPPPVTPTVLQPPNPPANVELRGITTLLGRPQVLLNFKTPARPSEPPKDRSLVMDVGQREGDVEVLEINPASGSIRIRNQGNELAMNLKDNASKPQAAPGMPAAPGLPAPLPAPALPAPQALPAAPTIPNATPTTIGTPKPTMPTRNLRAGGEAGSGASAAVVEQAALMEVERERTKDLVKQGKMPPLPPMPYSKEPPALPAQ